MVFPHARWPLLTLLLLGSAALAEPSAAVQRYVTAAGRLYEDVEYERALDQLQAAKQVADGVEAHVVIFLFEGVLYAQLRRPDDATASFKSGLFLDPGAALPVSAPPSVRRQLEDVRKQVRAELARRGTDEPRLTAPPPALAPRAMPSAGPDLWGAPPAARASRPPVAAWSVLGAGAAAAGVGVFFGLKMNQTLADARTAHFQSDAVALQRTATTDALVANVAFATAGAAAVVSTVLFFVERDR